MLRRDKMRLGKELTYRGVKYTVKAIGEDAGKTYLYLGKENDSIEKCIIVDTEELNPKLNPKQKEVEKSI